MIINTRHICIVTNDLEESLFFYMNILDLKMIERKILDNDYIKTILDINKKVEYVKLSTKKDIAPTLELYYFDKDNYILPVVNTFHHISFTVDNISDLYNRLNRLSYQNSYSEYIRPISRPKLDLQRKNYIMFTRDPDKNLIEFVQSIEEN